MLAQLAIPSPFGVECFQMVNLVNHLLQEGEDRPSHTQTHTLVGASGGHPSINWFGIRP